MLTYVSVESDCCAVVVNLALPSRNQHKLYIASRKHCGASDTQPYWVVTRLVTRRVRAHSCVRETCVRRLRVTVSGIILPFARGCRVEV